LTIEHELAKYDQELADKPRLLAINKMDLLSADERAAVSTTKALHTLGNRPTRDQNYINVLAF
jgi:GTPase involved in cell partitioning and DNA repair